MYNTTRVIKDPDGNVLTSKESVLRRWCEYVAKLINGDNEREREREAWIRGS